MTAIFAACGGDPVAPPTPVATSITVTPAASTVTAVGQTTQFSAAVEDQNGNPMAGVSVTWTSSEASVATIAGSGLATSRADGETTITASAGQASGTATFTVQQQVASVVVAPGSASLMPTETQQFTATVNDANGNAIPAATVAWSTGDPAVATVSASGLVTAVADGQTALIAAAGSEADTATVTVATVPPPNQSPTASISSPADGSTFTQGQSVNFAGSANDPEDGALSGGSLVWESSIDNQIGTGTSFGTSALSLGTHTIRLIATDSQGAADTAAISVTVNPPANQPPSASISAPSSGATFTVGQTVNFAGAANDPEDGALTGGSLVWESSIDNQIGTGTSFGTSALSVGTHTIRLIATDSQGAADTASISITVNVGSNQAPTASISAPSNGANFNAGDNVTFIGSATDPEDGPLGGSSLVWESSIDNQIGTGETFGTTSLSVGTHTIRLIATDSQGAADTASISITITGGNQSPNATIDTPGDGSEFSQGETVTFRGVATDPEDGPLTGGSLVWRSSIEGQIGTGAMFSSSILSLGTHTIRLIATDSQGAADTAIATITVLTIPAAMYDVEIRYTTGTSPTAAQATAFANAEARWEQLIRGDLPSVLVNRAAGNWCGTGAPAINETVDDLIILATLEAIDGPGGILGSAGPCLIRTNGDLTIVGRMRFDTADLAGLEAAGQLEDVILHEMGHVIGIGSLWSTFGLRLGTGGSDPYFIGTATLGAFENVGGFSYTGGNKVPVANTGGGGTRDAHWRESVFDDELMTGFLDSGVFNPLSIVTVNSLRDMGYVVNSAAADPLFLTLSLRLGPAAPKIELKGDVLKLPIHRVDSSGRVTGTILP